MYSANGRASLFERADAGAADGMRVFLGVGTNDYSWIRQSVTQFNAQLATRGTDVATQSATGGHDANTWHALAEPMLTTLFGNTTDATCAA